LRPGRDSASIDVVGFWSFPALGSLAVPALSQPVAFAVHLEDVDVVGETAEERVGKALRAEHLGPLVEG
jgi:hypothetical protein